MNMQMASVKMPVNHHTHCPRTTMVFRAIFSSRIEFDESFQEGGHAVGFEADWWALGAVTYEMLIGVPPFSAKQFAGRVVFLFSSCFFLFSLFSLFFLFFLLLGWVGGLLLLGVVGLGGDLTQRVKVGAGVVLCCRRAGRELLVRPAQTAGDSRKGGVVVIQSGILI